MMNTKMEEVDRKSDDCDLRVRKNDERPWCQATKDMVTFNISSLPRSRFDELLA